MSQWTLSRSQQTGRSQPPSQNLPPSAAHQLAHHSAQPARDSGHRSDRRRGAKDASANGSNAVNVTYAAMDPFFALVRFLQSSMAPPVSNNWGFINNPKFDELIKKARTTFDAAERDKALADLNAASIDDAAFLYVAHDVGPRALSPKIKNFVQPKSWFVDFSPITMTPSCE